MKFAGKWIGIGFLAGCGVLAGMCVGQWLHSAGVAMVQRGWL